MTKAKKRSGAGRPSTGRTKELRLYVTPEADGKLSAIAKAQKVPKGQVVEFLIQKNMQLEIDKQLEMFLLSGNKECRLENEALIYLLFSDSLPCIHSDASVHVNILSPHIWFEFCVDDEVLAQSERIDTTAERVTCSMLYGWSQSENQRWWDNK